MNTYSFFLFTKLYDVVNGISNDPYDLQFDNLSEAYDKYSNSEYNNLYEPEYECMLAFLESSKTTNQ
jgi:hypothetical protein